MPLLLPDTEEAPFYIFGKDAKGVIGAQLPSGAKAVVTSADPNSVVVNQDASPLPAPSAMTAPDGTAIPAGTPSVASGRSRAAATVAQPNTPINVTLVITNADGSPGTTESDTVTVTAGPEATLEGILFGAPIPVPAPAPAS